MKKVAVLTMLTIVLFAPICCAQDISRIVEDVGKSVVVVIAFNSDSTANKLGSGCFINNKGVILTNAHVIDSCLSIQIELTDTIIDVVDILYKDKVKDLALLKISVDSNLVKPVVFASLKTYKVGSHVIAVGNPLGLERSVSDGIISGVRDAGDGVEYIQTTVPISSGSSGGVLLNDDGELIGITTATIVKGQNINFAISLNTITTFIAEYSKQTNNYLLMESIKKPKTNIWRNVFLLCKLVIGNNIFWILPLIIIIIIALYSIISGKTLINILKPPHKSQSSETTAVPVPQNGGKMVKVVTPKIKTTPKIFQHKYYFMAGVILILLLGFVGKVQYDKYILNKMLVLGKENIDNGNNEAALEYLSKAIKFDNKSARAYFLRAWAQSKIVDNMQGEERATKREKILYKAIEDLNKSIAIVPTDTAFMLRSDIKWDLTRDAYTYLKDAEEYIHTFPNSPQAYCYKAFGLNYINNYYGAIECYSKALQLDEGQTQAYKERARCYYFLQDYTSAISDLNNSIKWLPLDLESYDLRATCYSGLAVNYLDDNGRYTSRGRELMRMALDDYYYILSFADKSTNKLEISNAELGIWQIEQSGISRFE